MSTQHREDGKPHKKRKIRQKPVLEQVPAGQQQQQQEDGNSKFARALGSTDYGTREKGLQALSRFLVHKDSMSELDMMKLWKGLFFCFWHSDKVPVQTELAERLAGLLQQMRPAMAQLYWAGLLATLRREWFAMDRHRLDKFLMLVRKFVAALLARLADAQWDADAIRSLTMQLPLQQQLIPVSSSKSLGLSYHLADVWLQELKQLPGQQQQTLTQQALLLLLEPFVAVLEAAGEQPLLARIKQAVFDVLVSDIKAAAAAAAAAGDDDEAEGLAYCAQLDATQLAAQLFGRGAAEGVRARNREVLYSISKELERAAGKRRKLAAAAAAEQQQQPASEQPKKKKRQQQVAEQQQQQAEADQEKQQELQQQQQETPSLKKKKKKHAQQEQSPQELQLQSEQQQQQPAVNGVTPKSGKKQKQKQAAIQQQQQEPLQNGQAIATTPVAAAAAAAAATPQPAAKPSSSKKKRKHGESTPAAAADSTPQPASAVGKTPGAGGQSTAKKGVVIDLKKNIYFAHGAPVPPAEMRSPPSTKPKGSALKKSSGSVGKMSRLGGSPHVPATAPAKQQQGSRLPQQQQQPPGSARKAVTPNSVPRVKASAFF